MPPFLAPRSVSAGRRRDRARSWWRPTRTPSPTRPRRARGHVDRSGGAMAHRSPEDLQDRRDIRRAQVLLGLARGLTDGESAEALRRRAAAESVSLHAAALAVLSDSPAGRRAGVQPSGPHRTPPLGGREPRRHGTTPDAPMSTLQPSHGPSGPARRSRRNPRCPTCSSTRAAIPPGRPPRRRRSRDSGLCGPGWTVLAAHGSRWSWSIRLDAHGAAYAAPTRVAQAVAVRVLSAHGIDVLGWNPADLEARAYAAVTVAPQIPAQRRASRRWWR